MLQFYFLSIMLNLLVGIILVYATNFMEADKVKASSAPDFDEISGSDVIDDNTLGVEENSVAEEKSEKNGSDFFKGGAFLDDSSFRLIIATLAGLTGVMKLLSPIQNDVPVAGDILPALAGIAGSFALLLEYYSHKTSLDFNMPSILESVFVGGRKYLGIFCIIAGVLHFVFPRALIL